MGRVCSRAGPVWALLCLLAGLGVGVAGLIAQGPLPGDVPLTRALQESLGPAPEWAILLTRTGKSPAVWLTLFLGTALAYARAGWLSTGVPALALVSVYAIDAAARAVVFAPKPTAEVVAVAAASSASGLPSTFALVYGAVFGAAIFAPATTDGVARLSMAMSLMLVVAGSSARITLGGHWASQILASLLIAFFVVIVLQRVLGRWLRGLRVADGA